MEFEVSRDDGEVATKEQIVSTTKELAKAHSRNRKKRRKVFTHVVDYLDGIIPAAYEMHKNYLMDNLVEWIEELTQLFIEVLKLLIPLLDQGNQKDNLKYELSTFTNVLESFLLHLQKWCFDQNENSQGKPLLTFMDLTFSLLVKIVNLAAETDSWRYVDVINIPITFILVEWGKVPKNRALEKFTNWTNTTFCSVIILEKRIVQCGDFACQYFLMILIQQWITWAGNKRAEDFLSQSFPTVSMKTRKFLLESEDFDLSARTFLNAVNSSTKGPRTKMITSVKCLYFFAENEHITPPEDCGQLWIDFSASSRRIHSFFATPNNAWINLSIDIEQIDSICVSWLRRNDGRSQFMTQTQSQALTQDSATQRSTASNLEIGCLIFLHIRLKSCFSEISNDLDEFQDKNILSLTLCFQDIGVIERVLHQMSFPTHANDHKHCSRPDELMKLLEIAPPIHPPSYPKSPSRRPSTPRPFSRVLFPASPIIPGRPSTPFRYSLSPGSTCAPTPSSLKTAGVQQRYDKQDTELDMDQEMLPASPIIPGRPSTAFRHSLSPRSTCPPTPSSIKTVGVQQRCDEREVELDMDQGMLPASPIIPGRPSTPFRHSLSPSSTCPPTPSSLKTAAVQHRYDKPDAELDMDQGRLPATPIIPGRPSTPFRHSLSPSSTCPPTPSSLKTAAVQHRYDKPDTELDMDQGRLPASPIIPGRPSTPFRHSLSPSSTCPPTPSLLKTVGVQQRCDKREVELDIDQEMLPANPSGPKSGRPSTPHQIYGRSLSPISTSGSVKMIREDNNDQQNMELDLEQDSANQIILTRPSTPHSFFPLSLSPSLTCPLTSGSVKLSTEDNNAEQDMELNENQEIISTRPSTPHPIIGPSSSPSSTAFTDTVHNQYDYQVESDEEIMSASPIICTRQFTPRPSCRSSSRSSLPVSEKYSPDNSIPCKTSTDQNHYDEQNIESEEEIMSASPIICARQSTPRPFSRLSSSRSSFPVSETCSPDNSKPVKTSTDQNHCNEQNVESEEEIMSASPIICARQATPRPFSRLSSSRSSFPVSETCSPDNSKPVKTSTDQNHCNEQNVESEEEILSASPIFYARQSTSRPSSLRAIFTVSESNSPITSTPGKTNTVLNHCDEQYVESDHGMPDSPVISTRNSTPHPFFRLSLSPISLPRRSLSPIPTPPRSLSPIATPRRSLFPIATPRPRRSLSPIAIPRRSVIYLDRSSPPPLTQFVDPYDITQDVDFFKEKKLKKYSRKKKSAPARRAPSRAPRCHEITASDEELDRLIADLPEEVPTAKKNKSRRAKKETKTGTNLLPKVKLPRKKPTVTKPIKPPKNKSPTSKQRKPRRTKKNQSPLEESVPKSRTPLEESDPKRRSPLEESDPKRRSPLEESDPKSTSLFEENGPKRRSPFEECVPKRRSPLEESDPKSTSLFEENVPKRRSPFEENIPKRKMPPEERVKQRKSPFQQQPRSKSPFQQQPRSKSPFQQQPRSKSPFQQQPRSKSPFQQQPRRSKSPHPSLLNKTFDWENMDFEYEKVVESEKKKSSVFLHDQQRDTNKGTPPPNLDSDDSFDWDNMNNLLDF